MINSSINILLQIIQITLMIFRIEYFAKSASKKAKCVVLQHCGPTMLPHQDARFWLIWHALHNCPISSTLVVSVSGVTGILGVADAPCMTCAHSMSATANGASRPH